MLSLFKRKPRSFLGIDIGTTGIRMVQLGASGKEIKLENYAYTETKEYMEILDNGEKTADLKMSDDEILKDILEIIDRAGVSAHKTVISVPISSAFSSTMVLPNIPKNEINEVVGYEAKQQIPLPMNEVVFGWSIINKKEKEKNGNGKKQTKRINILLVAIPKEVTERYSNIIKEAKLKLTAIETESFSLARSLAGDREGVSMIVDIGNKTTSVIIVENNSVSESHSIPGTGGEDITRMISRGFNINFNRAEALKRDVGLTFSGPKRRVSEIALPVVGIIISEIKKMNDSFFSKNKTSIEKIIISGSSAGLPGLVKYFSESLDIDIETANPWKNIVYDKALSEKIKKMSNSFSVAVGLALRGFEE